MKGVHKQLVRCVIDAINQQSLGYVWKMQCGLFRDWRGKPVGVIGTKGVPDVCGVLADGRFIGIEIKAGRDKQRPAQLDFENPCKITGAVCLLFTDKDDINNLTKKIKMALACRSSTLAAPKNRASLRRH